MVAISVDPPARSREVVRRRKLGFSILADEDRSVLEQYGLVHIGAGPGRSDTAIPAHVLVGRGGEILWKRSSVRVQDRPDPEELMEIISGLDTSHPD